MKTIALTILGIIVLAAAAVCWVCTVGLGKIAREEEQRQVQELQYACCYDDHDVSGLIEED